jgi:hypothetical protein
MVVEEMIPKRTGISLPLVSSSLCDIRGAGGIGDCLTVGCSKVEAGEAVGLAEADRLAVRSVPQNCFKQVWPDLAAACLRNSGSEAKIVEARLVTARR